MRDHEHPTPELLFRFFLGEASKTENRAIVCHLLAGCPGCVEVTRPLWWLADGRRRGWQSPRLARERRA